LNVLEATINTETLASLRDLAAGDRAFLDDLFATYLNQAEDVLAILRSALAEADRSGFGAAAHRLAGASLNVGALFVAAACRTIEMAMTDPQARPAASQILAVERELDRVIVAVATIAVA